MPGSRSDFTDVYIEEIWKTHDPASTFYNEEGRKQLISTLVDIFMAGAESTTTTLRWISLYMALHPGVQERVHAEIERVVGHDRVPPLSDRPLLPFTEACILETLRLSSIVPIGLFRRATAYTTFHGIFVPKDTTLIGNLHAVHHDSKLWGSNVEDFVPQRFLSNDESEVVKTDQLLAFSCGKRQCIGESLARNELFLFVSNIVQKFEIRADPKESRPSMEPNFGGVVAGPRAHQLIFSSR